MKRITKILISLYVAAGLCTLAWLINDDTGILTHLLSATFGGVLVFLTCT